MRPRLIAVDDCGRAPDSPLHVAASMRPRLIAVDDGEYSYIWDVADWASMRPRLIAVDDKQRVSYVWDKKAGLQ